MTLRLSPQWSASGDRVAWVLSLRNVTDKRLGLAFPTGQYADVALVRGGRAVYRWSRGMGFHQAFVFRTLEPRKTYVCTLSQSSLDTSTLENGRYQLFAWLKLWPSDRLIATRIYPLTITDG